MIRISYTVKHLHSFLSTSNMMNVMQLISLHMFDYCDWGPVCSIQCCNVVS